MKSDNYPKNIVKLNPYKNLGSSRVIKSEEYDELIAWHVARKAIEKARECAAISEALRRHFKSRRV